MWMTADTHIGQKRRNNQDVYLVERLAAGCFLLVCDGMGGEAGGAVASDIASKTVAHCIRRDITPDMEEPSVRRVLESAGAAANAAVFDAASENPALKGMGTTLVAAIILGDTAYVLHAGDSRAYLLRGDLLTQLTVDHTVAQMLVDRGEISESDAVLHPQRNYITRAVGVADRMRFDIFSVNLQKNDVLLLCSDGLYHYMSHEDLCALAAVAARRKDVSPLIGRANENGGGDNITAVLFGMQGEEAANG